MFVPGQSNTTSSLITGLQLTGLAGPEAGGEETKIRFR